MTGRSVQIRLGTALLVLAALVAACGGAAAPTAAPTPTPTVAPTATLAPTPPPTATPAPTDAPAAASTDAPTAAASQAANDPAQGIGIAEPYTISSLDASMAATLEASIRSAMGAAADQIAIGSRSVDEAGVTKAYILVMQFPTGTLTATNYASITSSLQVNGTGAFKTTTISGVDVTAGPMSGLFVGAFHGGDYLFIVMAPGEADVLPISTAIISVN